MIFRILDFKGLATTNEQELNTRCATEGIPVTTAGRGVTNKSKREALRAKAETENIQHGTYALSLTTKDKLWKLIDSILPKFELFQTDTRLGVGETTFQSKFRPVVNKATEQPTVIVAKEAFTGEISKALQSEVDLIFEKLKQHTDAFIGLTAKPKFSWEKAVNFEISGKDQQGIDISLDQRGSGMRRLLMVAFFQYMAKQKCVGDSDFIFAVEEPENCLHPSLQRELITSFRKLADEGCQVVVTSHSPVFAGASPIDDLALIVRERGVAKAIQTPDLDLSDVAEQLGVEPSDQITGYNACIFVEGSSDIEFLKTVALKLKEAGHLDHDFDDKRIGFVICGGENLKHWINLRAMNRLNRHFGVVVDSDRKRQQDKIPDRKLNYKEECETQGGLFFILKKREIENYLHLDAIVRSTRPRLPFDDFTDMKDVFGDNVFKVITDMSCEEILHMDRYEQDGVKHHELKEIIQQLLALPDIT